MRAADGGRRRWLMAGACAVAGLCTPALRAQPKPEKPRVTIAVEGRASFSYLPLTIAERLGFFAAEGLEVELIDVPNTLRALQSGAEAVGDVVAGAFDQTIHWQGKSVFFREFVLLGRAPQVAMAVSTRTMANYRSVVDLKGRRIGIPWFGSPSAGVATVVLQGAGLAHSDVQFLEFASAGAVTAALRAGQIDAICHGEPAIGMLETRGEVRVIADARSLKGAQELFGGPMPAASLYASQDFIQRHPNTVQALANAAVHALKWLQTAGPGDLIKAVPEAYLLGDRGLYLSAFNKVREAIAVDGLISDDGVRTALRVAGRLDPSLKVDKIDLAKTYTNDFARRAKEKFRA